MPPVLQIGKRLPLHPSYEADKDARAYWRLSYRVGRDYRDGNDPHGESILVKHGLEDDSDYKRRKRLTKPRNYVGPIIRKYADFVFRKHMTMPAEAEQTDLQGLLFEDVDGNGTDWEKFWRRRCVRAQIDREHYVLADSTVAPGVTLTQAQAQQQGARVYLRPIDADHVVWWRDHMGGLSECIVLMRHAETGELFARYYNATHQQDIWIKQDEDQTNYSALIVAGTDEERRHDWGKLPLVRLRPMFDDIDDTAEDADAGESQVGPLADSQATLYNLQALHLEEIHQNTYTQWFAFGANPHDVEGDNNPQQGSQGRVQWGSNRLVIFQDANGKVERIGSDVAQADSIRAAMLAEESNLFRTAGVTAPDALTGNGNAESGIARAFKFNDLDANLASLADAVEEAANQCLDVLHRGQEFPPISMPDDFAPSDYGQELAVMLDALSSPQMPSVLRKRTVLRFADRNLELSEDERADLETELDMPAAPSPSPFMGT